LLILKPATAGANEFGQLGLGDTETRGDETGYYDDNYDWITSNRMGDNLPAVSLGEGLTATTITCGSEHSCALLSNGQLKCWGECRFPWFPSRWPGSTPEGAGPAYALASAFCVWKDQECTWVDEVV